ncbi:hypothetical protein V7x_40850 [Crateriforma conspicua]|uniref:Uncharacterized protein n=1 Tax=Crateriforma conspicua TaxID=2527996 RepID=A0A5C6FPB9_9PLAN|nr:hypothetical protein V7x_40850 [Crateriforma conspicua]
MAVFCAKMVQAGYNLPLLPAGKCEQMMISMLAFHGSSMPDLLRLLKLYFAQRFEWRRSRQKATLIQPVLKRFLDDLLLRIGKLAIQFLFQVGVSQCLRGTLLQPGGY